MYQQPNCLEKVSSPLIIGIFLDSWYLGLFDSRWEEQFGEEDGTGWRKLWEQLWRCEGVRFDLLARRGELWFTCEPVVAVVRSPLMPCWSSDYSQDIMVLSDVWIWGSSYLGGPLSLVIAQLKGQLSLWEVSKFVLLSTFPFELSSLVFV